MGYFSDLAAQYVPCDYDHSYTPPEKQLLWRLEDLEERLHELTTQRTGRRDEGVLKMREKPVFKKIIDFEEAASL